MERRVNLTKEEFVRFVNQIKTTSKRDDDLSVAIEKACNHGCRVVGLYSEEISTIVSILSLAMGVELQRDGNIIEYFIWDLDFGKDYEEGYYTEEDDTPIDISTAEKLYDYIVRNARD